MNLTYFYEIDNHTLDQQVYKTMDNLVLNFRKANYQEVEREVEELIEYASEDDVYRLVLDYTNCLNFEWPQEIKRLALEEYHVIELICQKYGEEICAFLDFILFESDAEEDLRHLHSGAIHLLVMLALRDVRKDVTLKKIEKERDKIFYMYRRTQQIFHTLLSERDT